MAKIKNSFFKQFDTAIFKAVDNFKTGPLFSKIQEPLNFVEDDLRLIINNIISFALVLTPLMIISILFYMNFSYKKEIQLKKDIIATGNQILANKRAIETISYQVVSNASMGSEQQLLARIKSIASSLTIDQSKVSVSNFESYPSFSRSLKVNASINITKFSTSDLAKFVESLIQREKIKIEALNIKKNPEELQLDGNIKISLNSANNFSGGEEL